jgi:hypothetical protein
MLNMDEAEAFNEVRVQHSVEAKEDLGQSVKDESLQNADDERS